MNANLDCLSLLELLDLRTGGGDADARMHVEVCPRCRALLTTVPADIRLIEPPNNPPAAPTTAAQRFAVGAVGIRTGTVWRAVGEGVDITWIVVVIGRALDGTDRVMVAPVFGEPELATDEDLILEPSVLGYQAFVDIGNAGVLLREQLLAPLAALDESAARMLIDLYRETMSGEPAPLSEFRGPAVIDENDTRLLAADERRLALRALWRRTDQLVDTEQANEATRNRDDHRPQVGA